MFDNVWLVLRAPRPRPGHPVPNHPPDNGRRRLILKTPADSAPYRHLLECYRAGYKFHRRRGLLGGEIYVKPFSTRSRRSMGWRDKVSSEVNGTRSGKR